ncbi:hypothetical protein D3C71_2003300 [compost metagenome]
MNKAIENGISKRRVRDNLVPSVQGHLACDDGGPPLVTVLDDLQEIAPLIVVELFRSPVVKDKQIGLGQRFEDPSIPSVASCQSKRGE